MEESASRTANDRQGSPGGVGEQRDKRVNVLDGRLLRSVRPEYQPHDFDSIQYFKVITQEPREKKPVSATEAPHARDQLRTEPIPERVLGAAPA